MTRLSLLHRNAGPRALRLVQVYVFGVWFILVALDPLPRLAALPRSLYNSVGILTVVPGPLEDWLISAAGLTALKIALLIACGASLWPRAFRVAAPAAFALLLVYQSLIRGFTVMGHAEILLLLAAGILAVFANLPRRQEVAGYNPNGAALFTVVLAITVCYSLIGFQRLQTGVTVFTGDTILNYIVSRSLRTSYYDFNIGMTVVGWGFASFLLKLGYPLVTFAEALAPLLLVSRWFRIAFLLVMVPFHLMTMVLMEVAFTENLLLYVVLVDFSRRLPWFANAPEAATAPSQPAFAPAPGAVVSGPATRRPAALEAK